MNPTQTSFITWINENQLRKNTAQIILVLIALVLIGKTILLFRQASHVGQADEMPSQGIYVNGHAEEYVKPDTLVFSITNTEDGKDVSEVTKKTSEKFDAAIKVLKANGVEEKNIKTSYYNMSDRYETVATPCPMYAPSMRVMTNSTPVSPCSNTSSKITGVTLSQSLEVKIRDIEKNASQEKIGKIVTELAATGVKMSDVSYSVFDIEAAKAKIRGEAIKNAKENADKLESQLGVNFGEITGFTENTGGYPPYMNARVDTLMGTEAKIGVPVASLPEGEQKVSVDVSLTYLLK